MTAVSPVATPSIAPAAPAAAKPEATRAPGRPALTDLTAEAFAQVRIVTADSLASQAQVSALASTRRQQVKTFFAGVKENISGFISQSEAGVLAFIDARRGDLEAAARTALAAMQGAIDGALKAANTQIDRVRQTLDDLADRMTAALQSGVEGAAERILDLINSVPIPDIPGASAVREAAANILRRAAGAVTAALSKVLNFVHATVDAAASLASSFLGIVQEMVDAALSVASAAIMQILQAISQALSHVVTLVSSVLTGMLHATVWPLLDHIEALIDGAITHAEQEAHAQIQTNQGDCIAAIEAASGPGDASDLKEITETALENNHGIVQFLADRLSLSIGTIFGDLAAGAAKLIQQVASGITRVIATIASGVSQVIRFVSQVGDLVATFLSSLAQALSDALSSLLQDIRSTVQNPVDEVLRFASDALARLVRSIKQIVMNLIGGGSDSGVEAAPDRALAGLLSPGPSRGPITKPLPPVLVIIIKLAVGAIVAAVGALMTFLFGAELAAIIMANPLLAIAILVLILVAVALLILLLYLLYRLIKPKPPKRPTKRVISVTPSVLELGVGGRDIRATATIAPGSPASPALTWTVNPGGVPPAAVGIVGSGRRVGVRAGQPPAGTVTGGASITVRAELASDPKDFADSAPVMLVQVVTVAYVAIPALANVPSLIAGVAPLNTAEPNRDGIAGNTARVDAVTAPAGRPIGVVFRRSLGATAAGNIITPGVTTGDVGLRITDPPTDARLDETKPATAGPAALMADMTVNAVPLRVSALANNGPAGPYGVQNHITFASSDALHPPLARVVGELITLIRDDFNVPPPNAGYNNVFLLALAVPANTWNDNLITPVAYPNVVTGQPAIDVNRFVGPGVPHLPRSWILRQRFQYSAWTGAGTVISNTIDDGRHIRSLIGAQPNFQFKTEQVFPRASAPAFLEPYQGNPLIVFSNITATPTAPGATALAADNVATARLTVNSTVAGRRVNWSVLTGDMTITAGNPALLPAAATLTAGVQTGNFKVNVADTVFPNRAADGRVTVAAVRLRNMRAASGSVPPGTASTTVSLDAEPGGRTVNWSVDAAAAAAGVTVTPATTGPAAPPMTVTVTRPAGFTGLVTVTAGDSVVAKTASVKIRFR